MQYDSPILYRSQAALKVFWSYDFLFGRGIVSKRLILNVRQKPVIQYGLKVRLLGNVTIDISLES
jgi:hypothetical protein